MAGAQGYSLEQLLAWSLEDSLIDWYERSGDLLVIVQGGCRNEIPFKEAISTLKRMFRNHPRFLLERDRWKLRDRVPAEDVSLLPALQQAYR